MHELEERDVSHPPSGGPRPPSGVLRPPSGSPALPPASPVDIVNIAAEEIRKPLLQKSEEEKKVTLFSQPFFSMLI